MRDALKARLTDHDLDPEQIEALLKINFIPGTMSLCSHAMKQLTPLMAHGVMYHDAVQTLIDDDGQPLHHSDIKVAHSERLPYYGAILRSSVVGGDPHGYDADKNPEQHYGKISNVTVHVALNQLRKLVNKLIDRFGPPSAIHIELSRDLPLGEKSKAELVRALKANAKNNDDLTKRAARAWGAQSQQA